MTVIDAKPFESRLTDAYYQKVWHDNKTYLEKYGKGPYEFKGLFVDRTRPWLDREYWMGYEKWLRNEFGIIHVEGFREFHFKTQEQATLFILRWS